MPTTATHNGHATTPERVLCVAFARSDKTWKLGCTTGHGQKPRERSIAAGHQAHGLPEVAQAKKRFGLPETAPVVSGYAAGRDGFWLHRFLPAQGITNQVGDSSAIEVNRRKRRAKSDGLDVRKLLTRLMRFPHGERAVWRVVPVPPVDAEDPRHLPRDLEPLKHERASTTTRLKGLRSSQGRRLTSLHKFSEQWEALRLGDGAPIPRGVRRRFLRVYAQHECLSQQIAALEAARRALRPSAQEASLEKGRQLRQLNGIEINGAWVLVRECFGWRALKNRREVGGFAGGTPTPDHSGESARGQGITKSGNRHGRWMSMELAWSWGRYQPERALSGGFRERFGGGTRVRRIGLVAVARKLLMARWRCRETGVLPEGAACKEA